MELFLIDAIGPFFHGYRKRKVNWSKIPFTHLDELDDAGWQAVGEDLARFARRVKAMGYTAVSLDDVAHLAPHPLHEDEVRIRIEALRARMLPMIQMLRREHGLQVYLTSDVLPLSPALDEVFDGDRAAIEAYFRQLLVGLLDDIKDLEGVILRVGESDGTDVRDELRTKLHVRSPDELNKLLRDLLPEFEVRGKTLILRTWTVGAHEVGDLMWNAETLKRVLDGVVSARLIVSMKHGESDFFRHLPLNPLFARARCKVLLELQARREYEGGGLFPSYLGKECEKWAGELAGSDHLVGVSVWCQTGGWHRFHRMAFLAEDDSDVWIRINCAAVIAVFRDGLSAASGVARVVGADRLGPTMALLHDAEEVIEALMYLPSFATRALYFRRVRLPPQFHVYWDTVFINPGIRSLFLALVRDGRSDLQEAKRVMEMLPRMIALAEEARLPKADLEHMRDLMEILLAARRYVFEAPSAELEDELRLMKREYKKRWPKGGRYRIRLSLDGHGVPMMVLAWACGLLLRRNRSYRVVDRWFVLPLLGPVYRALQSCSPEVMPKFLRKSAMGTDVVLR